MNVKSYLQNHGPEILLFVGIAAGIGAAVAAARVTEKARQEVIETKMKVDDLIDEHADDPNNPDLNKEVGMIVIKGGLDVTKMYLPAISLGVLSIGALLWSHGIMKRREANLIAIYNALSASYSAYRRNVVAELGEEADKKFRSGNTHYEKRNNPETGEEEEVLMWDNSASPYAVVFSQETSREWRNDPQNNMFFLKTRQNNANDKLRSQGHLFLNEVYDMLGLPRTKAGCVVGWIARADNPSVEAYDDELLGDGFVDFGLGDVLNGVEGNPNDWKNRVLDFNVDGVIYNLIERI